jgi:uncharacterized membrane protein YfhO
MPLWVKTFPTHLTNNKIVVIKGNGSASNIISNSHKISFNLNLVSRSIVRINTIYYPGWKIKLDGQDIPISYANKLGVMDISVPEGTHAVLAAFTETPIRLISDFLSILSLLFLFLILIIKKKSNKNVK